MEERTSRGRSWPLAIGLPRRRVLSRLAALAVGATWHARANARPAAAQGGMTVSLPCVPCEGGCCVRGLTGGGVVQLPDGEAQIVVFATRLEEGVSQQGAGFVRWIDANWQNEGLTLESIGPITYGPAGDLALARDIRGIMQVNGQGEYAFQLRVTDYGPDRIGQDKAALSVGLGVSGTTPVASFRYEAEGTLVGGDFQLLDSVAPVAVP